MCRNRKNEALRMKKYLRSSTGHEPSPSVTVSLSLWLNSLSCPCLSFCLCLSHSLCVCGSYLHKLLFIEQCHILYMWQSVVLRQSVLLNTLIWNPWVVSPWRMHSKRCISVPATQSLCLCFYNNPRSTNFLLRAKRKCFYFIRVKSCPFPS